MLGGNGPERLGFGSELAANRARFAGRRHHDAAGAGQRQETGRSDGAEGRAKSGNNYLLVGRNVPDDFPSRIKEIETQTIIYGQQRQQLRTYKSQMLLTLLLFTILLMFSAMWFALFLSKQVTVPIQALAEATQEIIAGNFETRVNVRAQDELETGIELLRDALEILIAKDRNFWPLSLLMGALADAGGHSVGGDRRSVRAPDPDGPDPGRGPQSSRGRRHGRRA